MSVSSRHDLADKQPTRAGLFRGGTMEARAPSQHQRPAAACTAASPTCRAAGSSPPKPYTLNPKP